MDFFRNVISTNRIYILDRWFDRFVETTIKPTSCLPDEREEGERGEEGLERKGLRGRACMVEDVG